MATTYLVIIAIFATAILGIYALVPQKKRYLVLLIASLLAYLFYSKIMIIFLLTTVLTTYLCGLFIDKLTKKNEPILRELPKEERKIKRKKIQRQKRWILIITIAINLLILLVLKYFNFFDQTSSELLSLFNVSVKFPIFQLLLPLGISYYTLQAIGYIIDVTNGKYEVERNPFKLALFISYFPQLLEGPIGRYNEMNLELTSGEPLKKENIARGWLLALWGLFKIIVVSNRFGMLTDAIFKNYTSYSGWVILLGIFSFTFQLYTEFSGYINIATGVSKMFGISLKKNFDAPFIAQNVGDFWRRWHISLGNWFRDYVFYPITMSSRALKLQAKEGKVGSFYNHFFIIFAMLWVWLLTGLWHGASMHYVLYGLYYFGLMCIFEIFNPLFSKLYKKLNIKENNPILYIIRIIKTCTLVGIGMLLFRTLDVDVFFIMLSSIFKSFTGTFDLFSILDHKEIVIVIISMIIVITSGVLYLKKIDLVDKFMKCSTFTKISIFFIVIIIITIFGAYGNGYLPPDPIYGGF